MMLMRKKFLKQISQPVLATAKQTRPCMEMRVIFSFILITNVDGKSKKIRK